MSGLILAGIGKGISDAGASVGNFMFKEIAADEARQDRLALQRERLAEAAIQKERDRDLRAEIAASRKTGEGNGGIAIGDMAEGGAAEGIVARQAGMTVPELRAYRRSSETGDMSLFKRETTREIDVPNPDNPDYDTIKQTVKENTLPPGFDKEYRAKLRVLASIEESYALGKNYDSVQKGRQTGQEIAGTEAILADPSKAGIVGTAIAGGQGKNLYGGNGDVTRQNFTGETNTTAVGDSQIRENDAQAAKSRADAANAPKEARSKEFNGLQQQRLAIDADLERIERSITALRKEQPKGWQDLVKSQQSKIDKLEIDKADVQERLREFTTKESNKGKPDAPAKPGAPAAPTISALPKGAVQVGTSNGKPVFQTPDGKKFIQK
jgi:hypothetical protein